MIAAELTHTVADLTWVDVGYAVLAFVAFVSVLLIITGYIENRRDERLGLREHVPWFGRWRR